MTDEPADPGIRVAIYGSCVSRDTCEFMPESEVVCYVARQSAIVALNPVGEGRFPSTDLDSAFQAKMFDGDQRADAAERISHAEVDLVLVDLVDERRGVWVFPDGAYLTNSVEAYRAGVEKWAPAAGARLIEFGTDEHFDLWQRGFRTVMGQLEAHAKACLLLDIAWAEAEDGAPLPGGVRNALGVATRRIQRGWRGSARAVRRGQSLFSAAQALVVTDPTATERLIADARRANKDSRRYIEFAEEYFDDRVIRRSAAEVRMDAGHRWGLAPFHFRESDYASIVEEIRARVFPAAT